MSRSKLSVLIVFLSSFVLTVAWSQKPVVKIHSLLAQKDYVDNGAKGILLSGICDFSENKQLYPSDSLIRHAFSDIPFYLTITPKVDTSTIKPALGYNAVFKEDKISDKLKIKPSISEMKTGKVSFSWFIPYAAFKLNNGKNSISFDLSLYGKDGFNRVVSAKLTSEKVEFEKPKTRVFELSLDSLQVKQLDVKGQAWDPTLAGYDGPDLDFRIQLGTFTVNKIHKSNNYTLSFPEKPRLFKFVISENDEVAIYLVDEDEIWDDAIANWKFNSTNMKEGVEHTQPKPKANLVYFSFFCKIGPLK